MTPLQPQFKIRVYRAGVRPGTEDSFSAKGSAFRSDDDYTYMDVESCTTLPVTYEEEASLLNTLSFTIDKHAEVLLHRFRLGQWIVFYGGYYDESGKGVRKVFSGTVTRIITTFPNSGVVKFTVECMSYGFTKMGKDNDFYVYPDKNSPRNFAKGKTTLSLSELVRGISTECGMEIGDLILPKEITGLQFTEKNVRRQKNVSDWKFLHDIARAYNCFMWTEFKNGKEVLHFVDKTRAVKNSNTDINFLYPLKGEGAVTDITPEEMQRYDDPIWNRPRLIWDVTVEEDISLAYAVSRSASYIDKETGEQKEALAEVLTDKEGRRITVFYELDEQKVADVDRTNPQLADQIRSSGGAPKGWKPATGSITPEYTAYYYKEIKRYDNDDVAVNDQAFFGIYVTGVCNMDLDLRSQRSYSIRGIIRYSTSDKTGTYFLRGLKHIWSSLGCTTELDFIK